MLQNSPQSAPTVVAAVRLQAQVYGGLKAYPRIATPDLQFVAADLDAY